MYTLSSSVYIASVEGAYCFIQAIEEQFPYEEGYRINYKNFKFKKNKKPHVRVVPTYECDKLVVVLDPTSARVTQYHANSLLCIVFFIIIINFRLEQEI